MRGSLAWQHFFTRSRTGCWKVNLFGTNSDSKRWFSYEVKERKEIWGQRFSSHSTQRVINPNATGVGGTQTANFYVTAQFPFQNKGWASPWEESEIQLGGLPQWAYLLDLVWVLSYLATGPCFQGSYFYFAFLIVLSRTVRLLSYYVAGSGNSWEDWVATLWGCFWLLLVFLAKDIFIQLK